MTLGAGWMPLVITTTPPVITNVTVASVGYYSATITWTTGTKATSAVEWGPTDASSVTANAYSLDTSHQVTVTGLTSGTTYQFRVRSQDNLRNMAESPLSTFTTTVPGAPLPPTPSPVGSIFAVPGTPAIATLQWTAVTSPVGNPVQYHVVLGTDPTFGAVMFDSGWQNATSWTVSVPFGNPNPTWYYWRVQAKDVVTGIASTMSATSQFDVWIYNPYGG
jgi:hypothetical protein